MTVMAFLMRRSRYWTLMPMAFLTVKTLTTTMMVFQIFLILLIQMGMASLMTLMLMMMATVFLTTWTRMMTVMVFLTLKTFPINHEFGNLALAMAVPGAVWFSCSFLWSC